MTTLDQLLKHPYREEMNNAESMSHVEWSEAQRAQRGRFALANEYVKAVKADPKVWAAYQKKAKKQKKRARDLAFSDYCQGKDLLSKK